MSPAATAPRRRKLRRHRDLRIVHRRDAEIMDHVGAAELHVCALDQIAERALGEPGPQPVAQRRHAQIGKMRADAQPVELFGRLDHAQPHVSLVQARDRAERGR